MSECVCVRVSVCSVSVSVCMCVCASLQVSLRHWCSNGGWRGQHCREITHKRTYMNTYHTDACTYVHYTHIPCFVLNCSNSFVKNTISVLLQVSEKEGGERGRER